MPVLNLCLTGQKLMSRGWRSCSASCGWLEVKGRIQTHHHVKSTLGLFFRFMVQRWQEIPWSQDLTASPESCNLSPGRWVCIVFFRISKKQVFKIFRELYSWQNVFLYVWFFFITRLIFSGERESLVWHYSPQRCPVMSPPLPKNRKERKQASNS